MKRLAIASLAALTLVSPLAATSASAHPRDRYDRHDSYERHERREDRREDRHAYREGYREGRFDRHIHNGYYVGRTWYYGPPPERYAYRSDFRPAYRDWRRGDYLPPYYRHAYAPVDYRAYRLAPPPRGAHWVRDDRGDYLLVGVATGLILGLALH